MPEPCRSHAFATVIAAGDEHAELSDSIAHEFNVHRPNERAVDLRQDQRLSAKKALDLSGIGPDAHSLPHARFSVVIDIVDQIRKSLDLVSSEVRLNREPSCHFLFLLHVITFISSRRRRWRPPHGSEQDTRRKALRTPVQRRACRSSTSRRDRPRPNRKTVRHTSWAFAERTAGGLTATGRLAQWRKNALSRPLWLRR